MKAIEPTPQEIDAAIDIALAEDIAGGDATTDALITPGLQGRATLLAKEAGILAGVNVAARVFQKIDTTLKVEMALKDGTRVIPGDIIGTVSGSAASLLKAERTALNFLQRMSGVATSTAQYANAVKSTRARIYDTRKTTPGLRVLEKYAVRMGGGYNHRRDLGDAVLIKDNHIAAMRAAGFTLEQIISQARQKARPGITIEVEVTSVEEAAEALKAKPDIIMLDNMGPKEMKRAVEVIGGKAKVEASGNIRLNNVREVAETGVDIISIGALTHSYKALDISLEMETE